jgi:hypothetical protein
MSTFRTALTLAAALTAPALFAQEIPQEGPVPTTALIRVETKANAPIDASTLKLELNGQQIPIDFVTPVAPQTAEVAILIDEGLRRNVALQLDDIKQFLLGLPPGVRVMIGYMANGGVRSESKTFSPDHAEIADQLRIPNSIPGISASPYFCLSEFVKHWPSNTRANRFVLFITNGVDPYNGSTSILNQDSPYVQTAQEDAQRASVAVYSLYYPDSGMRGGRANFSGQSYLNQISEATGGESLYNGTISPVSFAPFLKQFDRYIRESYTLGFHASSQKERRNTLTRIKVKSNVSGIKVHAPDSVHPGNEN